MENVIATRLSVLGHAQRLVLFRLLMRRYPDHVAAGELARALDLKASTLSSYLASMMQAGLVRQMRSGTSLRYAINMAVARETFDYLILDCCRGRPDACSPVSIAARRQQDRKFSVLFICTGNSVRSIFAEAILRAEAGTRFEAFSAGIAPKPNLDPIALDVLGAMNVDATGLKTRHVAEFQVRGARRLDFIFTLCDHAANQECPAWTGTPISAHWGIPDPPGAQTGNGNAHTAYRQAFDKLRSRILDFIALPLETMEPLSIQQAADRIGCAETPTAA
ncbi:MAG: helix-turn-helix domain-containing protein [Pseudomonadota bacterium]